MQPNIQPILENEEIILYPLKEDDFDAVFAAASNPRVWEQHPNKNRWKRDVFRTYFEGAMESGGAFRIVNKATGMVVGSTRFYDYNSESESIFIGYTFYSIDCWGKGINLAVKKLMLDYIFQFVTRVLFHIGANNVRSQVAITRLGAVKIDEQEVAYFGEPLQVNFVYEVRKEDWVGKH